MLFSYLLKDNGSHLNRNSASLFYNEILEKGWADCSGHIFSGFTYHYSEAILLLLIQFLSILGTTLLLFIITNPTSDPPKCSQQFR